MRRGQALDFFAAGADWNQDADRLTPSCNRVGVTPRLSLRRRADEYTSSRPDDLFRKRELCALVEEATAQLSARHRQVFVLRDVEGKSYEEIAEITGTKVGTVKSRLSRARQSVAAIMEPWLD